jgi:hypothetical protein
MQPKLNFLPAIIGAILSLALPSYGAPTMVEAGSFNDVLVLNSTAPAALEHSKLSKRFTIANIAVYGPYSCSATTPIVFSVSSDNDGIPFNINFESGAAVLEGIAPGCRAVGCFVNNRCYSDEVSPLQLDVCHLAKKGDRKFSWDKFMVICDQ